MRRPTLLATLVLLALPASAQAGWFAADVVDGPSADIVRAGDVDLGRDGTGAAVYVKRADGAERIFVTRFADGAFQPGERVDGGTPGASSQPVVAAADGGRLAIAWVSGGNLYTTVRPLNGTGFTPPRLLAEGSVSNPSIDMSINGAAYVSFTQAGDVKVARANRDTPDFTTLPAPVDVDVARAAGTGAGRSRVATSADGSALVVWGEQHADGRMHVHARRLFELRLSTSPQDLTLDEVAGEQGLSADSPEVDMEDDSSYAQVVFRQQVVGRTRIVMRRLVGSAFEPADVIDQGNGGVSGRVDLSGRGELLWGAGLTANEAIGGSFFNNKPNFNTRLDTGNGIAPQTIPAVGENEDGGWVWFQGTGAGDATVRGRYLDAIEKPVLEPEATLSVPANGPVDLDGGLDAASSRAADIAVVFVQGTGDQKRLMGAVYDRAPSRSVGLNTTNLKALTRLVWSPGLNLLGTVTYRVLVDGEPIGETQDSSLRVTPDMMPSGAHTWQVVGIDRRGQTTTSRSRTLRVDNTPPKLRSRLTKRGRVVTVIASGSERRGRYRTGFRRVQVDWGPGGYRTFRGRISRRYSSAGTYEVRVRAVDRGGAQAVATRTVRIG